MPSRIRFILACVATALAFLPLPQTRSADAEKTPDIFSRDNLIAWCIVPFDAKKRGPEERAAMLEKLGFKHFAYDYREEHVPTFDAEIEALQRHGVSLDAWWFPPALNDEARLILNVCKKHGVHPQLWVTGGGVPVLTPEEQQSRVEDEARRLRPIAEAAAQLGSKVGLYNHGGWFGEPENQLAIIERLARDGITNVGLVYNFHHGHDQLDRFAELLAKMKPHLLALNLNGMTRDGERTGKKILPLGQGDLDLQLLRTIRDSGWRGLIGILNHTSEDAEVRLRTNLEGLDRLVAELK
jgi:sugar phosphate isomerase/epimerase